MNEPLPGEFNWPQEYTPESIALAIDQMLRRWVPSERYSRAATLSSMGINSALLLELRERLGSEFRVDLPINFLVEHETADAITAYMVECKIHTYRGWLYETVWKSCPKPDPVPLAPDGRWLLFCGDDPVTDRVRDWLNESNQQCVMVRLGEAFRRQEEGVYTVNPRSPTEIRQLILEVITAGPLTGVTYAWGFASSDPPELLKLTAHHQQAIAGLTSIVNELALVSREIKPRLWVITQSIPEDGQMKTLAEWPLNALCKVIREEYPGFEATLVAIDADRGLEEACHDLVQEIAGRSIEPCVAYRDGQRLVPRFQSVDVKGLLVPTLASRATYMIVGGFRPLGLLLARWYVAHGARSIILADEIEILREVRVEVENLRRQGALVHIKQLPLDDKDAMTALISDIRRNLFPLKGVIHATVMVDNDLLLRTSWERFLGVHRLKVSSAWIVNQLTEDLDLDHFVLFSSCLPDLAPFAKANHATGNSFLEALSHYRRRRGLPSLTVQWGPWALNNVEVRRLETMSVSNRVEMLTAQDGLRLLEQLFNWARPVVVAANIHWELVFQQLADRQPLFNDIAVELGYKRTTILKDFLAASSKSRGGVLLKYVQESVRRISGVDSVQPLGASIPLSKLGLGFTHLNRLRAQFRLDFEETGSLPLGLVDGGRSLSEIARDLSTALEPAVELREAKPLTEETLTALLKQVREQGVPPGTRLLVIHPPPPDPLT